MSLPVAQLDVVAMEKIPRRCVGNPTSLKPIFGLFLIRFSKMYRHEIVFTLDTLVQRQVPVETSESNVWPVFNQIFENV